MPKVGSTRSERSPIFRSSKYEGMSIAVATVKMRSVSICLSASSSKSPYLSRWTWASMSMKRNPHPSPLPFHERGDRKNVVHVLTTLLFSPIDPQADQRHAGGDEVHD